MPTYNYPLTTQINLQTIVSSIGGGTNNAAAIVLAAALSTRVIVPAAAQDAVAGQQAQRNFGPLTIGYVVDDVVAQVTVNLQLGGEPVGAKVLKPDTLVYPFNVVAGGNSAS